MTKNKKNIFVYIFLIIFIILLLLIVYLFIANIKNNILNREISDHNISFNEFDRNLKGSELVSLINFTVNYNNTQEELGSNDLVNIEVQITEEKTVGMDSIIKSGIENFVMYLGDQNLKIIDKKYHNNGKISLMKYKLLPINSINNKEEKINI